MHPNRLWQESDGSPVYFSIVSLCQQALRDAYKYSQSSHDLYKFLGAGRTKGSNPTACAPGQVMEDQLSQCPASSQHPAALLPQQQQGSSECLRGVKQLSVFAEPSWTCAGAGLWQFLTDAQITRECEFRSRWLYRGYVSG